LQDGKSYVSHSVGQGGDWPCLLAHLFLEAPTSVVGGQHQQKAPARPPFRTSRRPIDLRRDRQATMSVCRPARCLFTRAASTTLPKAAPQRSFQTSASRQARKRRPNYPSIKAEDLKLLNQAAEAEFPKYDTSETSLLEKKYSASQIAAIKAAESAIDPRDIITQGQRRNDTWRLPYEDDLAEVDPVTDTRVQLNPKDIPGKVSFRRANEAERNHAISRVANETLAKLYPDGFPEGQLDAAQEQQMQDAIEAALTQAATDPRVTYTSDNPAALEALADPRYSLIGPDLPRLENRMARQTRRLSTEEEEDPRQKRLLQYLGWDKQKLRSIRVKTLVVHGVTNQTRMGKIRSMYYLTIAGNQDGLLGVGEGKSVEPDEGRKQSVMSAIRNMRPVPRYENRTTFGNLERKVGATKVQLFARPPGKDRILTFSIHMANILNQVSVSVPSISSSNSHVPPASKISPQRHPAPGTR
jgi:small subunit ribosomal protein S5